MEVRNDVLELIKQNGGYYEAGRDSDGNFLTPLVVTGKQEVAAGSGLFQFLLSPAYYNLARLEQKPCVAMHLSRMVAAQVVESLGSSDKPGQEAFDCLLTIPRTTFGSSLAQLLEYPRYTEAEKRIIRPAGDFQPPDYDLILERHRLECGLGVAIFDDVGNNFTGVNKLLTLISQHRCNLVAVICVVNRSGQKKLPLPCHGDIPIVSLLELQAPQYHQDHSIGRMALSRRNVVVNPKKEWDRLLALMNQS